MQTDVTLLAQLLPGAETDVTLLAQLLPGAETDDSSEYINVDTAQRSMYFFNNFLFCFSNYIDHIMDCYRHV